MEKSKMSPITRGNIFEVEAISSSAPFFAKKNPRSMPGEEIFLLGRLRLTYEGPSNSRYPGSTDGIMGRSSVLIDSRRRELGEKSGEIIRRKYSKVDRTIFPSLSFFQSQISKRYIFIYISRFF